MTDTIFALSSGSPPAAIAVLRISGPHAGAALARLSDGTLPAARRATLRALRDGAGALLDRALVLWFPGPATATGEDLAELHLHGGRAVVRAVELALAQLTLPDEGARIRPALAGEFTRRAFANGRMDLAEAEGLADLLSAETELQRRNAAALAGGALSRQVDAWREKLLTLSALVEAALDFADEGDVEALPEGFVENLSLFHVELSQWLARPRAEALKDGFRVILAGPPNAGKSTLFNALVDDEAAITSPLEGTTRDVLTRAVALDGVAFVFTDTAGLRDETDDAIEAIGIDRARAELARSDLVLWLGPEGQRPDHDGMDGQAFWEIAAQADKADGRAKSQPRHAVSARTGLGMDELRDDLVRHARASLPRPGELALNRRQSDAVASALEGLDIARSAHDPLIVAEGLRVARVAFDALTGRAATENMLDALFGRFCIGK